MVAQCPAVVEIMDVVIVDRRQTGEEHRSAEIGLRAPGAAENSVRLQGMSLDRKFLVSCKRLPAKVAGLGKHAPISVGADGKRRTPGRNRRVKNSAYER